MQIISWPNFKLNTKLFNVYLPVKKGEKRVVKNVIINSGFFVTSSFFPKTRIKDSSSPKFSIF